MPEDVITIPAPAGPSEYTIGVCMDWRQRLASWNIPGLGGAIDGRLLIFLVLFLNVKLAIKIPALVLIYAWQPGSKSFKRLPLFYPLIILIGLIDWFLFQGVGDPRYDLVAGAGVLFWILCIGAVYQVRQFAITDTPDVLHRTLLVFFLLNALVSFIDLARIVWEIKVLNPYLYQGIYQKYFIRTGDYVKGLTFDTSTTNALINAFGVVYFLARKNGGMMLCCMACLLATGSNFTNLLLLAVFAWLFLFQTDRDQKGGIILCILMGVVFLGKVSPQNNQYTSETFGHWLLKTPTQYTVTAADAPAVKQPAEQASREKRAYIFLDSIHELSMAKHIPPTPPIQKPQVPEPDINSAPYQNRPDTSEGQRKLLVFIDTHRADLPLASLSAPPTKGRIPGKLLALEQIGSFYRAHPAKLLFGNGAGNFSSKLAFRATALDIEGKYPSRLAYIHPDFLRRHLDLYLAYFAKPKDLHSLTNSPDSVFGQMLGEYGALGFCAFVGLYLGYFIKRTRPNSYSIPVFILMTGAFFIGYWFEQLSIVVLFELLLFIDARKASS